MRPFNWFQISEIYRTALESITGMGNAQSMIDRAVEALAEGRDPTPATEAPASELVRYDISIEGAGIGIGYHFKICPQPDGSYVRYDQAAAEITRLREALTELVEAVTTEVNEKGAGGYMLARLSDARFALASTGKTEV